MSSNQDYSALIDIVTDTMAKGGHPLNEAQRMLLAGSLAGLFEHVVNGVTGVDKPIRPMGEIVDDALEGGRPTYHELRYAICAYERLTTFDQMGFTHLMEAAAMNAKPIGTRSPAVQQEESMRRLRSAMSQSPKVWLGAHYDPGNKDVVARRRESKRMFQQLQGVDMTKAH